jgi:hypothetical protein
MAISAEAFGRRRDLDHAEHDGADEGHREVRGDNAQCPGERHEVAPSARAASARTSWLTESLVSEKAALLSARGRRLRTPAGAAWLKNTEIKALKSL